MSILDDVATFLLDPTGTTLAAKKAAEAAAAKRAAAAAAKAAASGALNQQAPQGGIQRDTDGIAATVSTDATSERACCNEFQLQDGFLLNTRTGAVWKYDKDGNEFKYVERGETAITKAAWGIFGTHLIDELHKEKNAAATTMHYSVAAKYEKDIATMIKILEAKAKGVPLSAPR